MTFKGESVFGSSSVLLPRSQTRLSFSWQTFCFQRSWKRDLWPRSYQLISWLIHADVGVHYHHMIPRSVLLTTTLGNVPKHAVVSGHPSPRLQACSWVLTKPRPLSFPVPSVPSKLSGGTNAHFPLELKTKHPPPHKYRWPLHPHWD